MIDPQEFAQLHANAEANYQSSMPKQSKKKKNLLEALLPTAGGIGGSLGGAAIGTALLPGLGTIAGGLIGGALGGGGAKVAENALEGEKLTSGVGGEALTNGLFGAGPLRILKVGAEAAKGVKAGLGAADALRAGGEAAIAPSAIKTAVANKLGGTSENLAAKSLGLTKGQKNAILERTGSTAGSIAKEYGVREAGDVSKSVKPLYNEFDAAISSIPKSFSKDEVSRAFKSVYEPMLAKGTPLGTQTVGANLKSEADNLLKGISKGGISPADLNKKRQAFDKLAYKFKSSDPNAYDVNKQGRDVLSNLIHAAASDAGIKTTSGRTLKETGQEINKLERLGKAANKNIEGSGGSTVLGLGNLPGTVVGGAAGLPGAVAGAAANSALNSSAGRRLVAGAADKLAQGATKSAANNPYGLTQIAKRESIGAAPDLIGALQSSNSQPTTTMANTATTTPNIANISSLSQNNSNMSIPALDPANIQSNIQSIIKKGGTLEDATKYISLVQALSDLDQSQSQSQKLNATQLQQANNAQSGLQSLSTIQGILQQNPNASKLASLPGGSFTQALTGTGEYSAAINNATDVIGRLRSGGAINADEEKRFRSLLPASFDDQDTVNYKLGALSDLFNRFVNPQAASADTASILSAIGG